MTIDEKRDALANFCDSEQTACDYCILSGNVCNCGNGAWFKGDNTLSDAEVIGAYEIVFGYNNENDEKMIINTDNVTIYFK